MKEWIGWWFVSFLDPTCWFLKLTMPLLAANNPVRECMIFWRSMGLEFHLWYLGFRVSHATRGPSAAFGVLYHFFLSALPNRVLVLYSFMIVPMSDLRLTHNCLIELLTLNSVKEKCQIDSIFVIDYYWYLLHLHPRSNLDLSNFEILSSIHMYVSWDLFVTVSAYLSILPSHPRICDTTNAAYRVRSELPDYLSQVSS